MNKPSIPITCIYKKLMVFLIFIILLVFPAKHAFSIESSEFIKYLTNRIYEDCKGNNITMHHDIVLDDNGPIKIVRDNRSNVDKIINTLNQLEPFDMVGSRLVLSSGKNGMGILTCGTHILDINNFTYLWDNIVVETPKKQLILSQYVENANNATLTGDNYSNNNDSNFSKTTGNNSPAINNERNTKFSFLNSLKIIFNIKFVLSISLIFNLYFLWKSRRRKS